MPVPSPLTRSDRSERGAPAYDRCQTFVKSLPGLEKAVVAEGSLPLPDGGFPRHRRESWTFDHVLEEMAAVGQGT